MKKIDQAVRELGGVWPSDHPKQVYLYRLQNGRYVASAYDESRAPYICTRYGLEECTRRLRNEPSWSDSPDWAVAKAQDSTGWWHWYSHKLLRASKATCVWQYNSTPGRYLRATQGEVIGDWKQTLRLRPEEEKVENKNDWYKRGEYPPAGIVCEVLYDGTWEQTKVIGWDMDKIIVATPFDDITSYDGIVANPNIFRPLQSERERWVEMARKATFEADEKQNYYEAIYDSGLAKMPEDE